ncbi:MAG: DegT/DnrJ/EryC1/StrS family aminotransferase [Bryobacteraceae bacterium]
MPEPAEWIPFLAASYAEKRFSNFGPAARLLEERLTEKYATRGRTYVLTASATTGLAAVLMAAGIRGRVALPAFTFPATLQAVRMARCTPVLCDVDPETWEMSPATLQPALALGVDAVMPVRAFGFCRNLQPLASMCHQAGVPMVIDSAAAFGGQLDSGEWAGAQGIAEVFSFHATKVFGIGEGGLISVDSALAEQVRRALNFGIRARGVGPGLNGKLAEFAAAVGLAALTHMDEFVARRQTLAAHYLSALSAYPRLTFPAHPGKTVWQCYPVLLPDDLNAASFVEQALEGGVEIRRYYHPALAYEDLEQSFTISLRVSQDLAHRMVCLPLYSDMSAEEQEEILQTISLAFRGLPQR